VQQVALISDQQQAGGVAVQPADGADRRVLLGPARQQEVKHGPAFPFIARADTPQRLVKHGQQAVRTLHGFPVDQDVASGDLFV
jgi:hypothetical protein